MHERATALRLEPWNHLRRAAEEDTWIAFGNDPGFRCVLPDGGLEPGWYEVDIELERISGPAMWPYLYPNYGYHELEPFKIFLPFVEGDRTRHRGIAVFTQRVKALRFDPAVAVCKFRLGAFRLRRVGKREAALSMLRAMAKAPKSTGTKLRWLGALLAALLTGGPSGFARRLNRIYADPPKVGARASYEAWLELYGGDTPEALCEARRVVAALAEKPLVSIVLPVYNTPERWLRRCIETVRAQVYEHWELCIANDASPAPHVRRILDEYAALDSRIKVVHRARNGHISECSNSAVDLATGRWIALLDHDDELHPLALAEIAAAAGRFPRWRLIYSDEDKIDEHGNRYDPYMKPDWNYDLFLSHNCISHLGVYDAALLRAVGGFRKGMEGSQDWDLALRCVERLDRDQIGHVPSVLYHWRAIEGSTALAPQEKDYAHEAGRRAIAEHLERIASPGRVEDIPGMRGNYRVRYPVPGDSPLVSIIIPTRDKADLLRDCIGSILESTRYPRYEIVVVDNQSVEHETLSYFESLDREPRVRILRYDAPFNYSAMNNMAAAEARGDLLCLMNNDITVLGRDWLDEMAGHASRPHVGAVGAMLYYPNDTIQHAGVIIGAHGIAAHAYSGFPRGYAGHMSRARLVQEMTAVTAACLVVRRTAFDEVGGFDPRLEVAFNDVDFCLKLREAGYRNVWTPFAELYHHESATRGYENSPDKMARFKREVAYMSERWQDVLRYDPAYSRNMSVTDELNQLAFPPRDGWPGPEFRRAQ